MPKKKKENKKPVKPVKKNDGKESEVLSVKKHIEGDMEITETAKVIDNETDVFVTPWGSKVKAKDVIKVLDEYYSLSSEDKISEKKVWVELISKMMGQNEAGLKIVDIELAKDGSKNIKFIYR